MSTYRIPDDDWVEALDRLKSDASDESPISPIEEILFYNIVKVADDIYVADRSGTPPPNVSDLSLLEGTRDLYIQKWNERTAENKHKIGVSARKGRVYVFTGKHLRPGNIERMHPMYRNMIDVTDEIGPWNSELRKMVADIKAYIARRRSATFLIEFFRARGFFTPPHLPGRTKHGSSAKDLELARKIVTGSLTSEQSLVDKLLSFFFKHKSHR